jgi:hypothetical protein
VDEFDIPKYYTLMLDRWKGNPNRKLKQTLLIPRNYINPRYCPVVAMTLWLKFLNDVAPDHKNGPLFPALRDDHNEFILDEGDTCRSFLKRNIRGAGTSPRGTSEADSRCAARTGGDARW